MKRLIFSDCHFTTNFELSRFNLLTSQIEQADEVIILGDFWDGYLISFDDFLSSEWQKLFPILKSKKTKYLTGNHDHHRFLDDRVYQFCDQYLESYQFQTGKIKYHCEHGHQIIKHVDGYLPFVHNKYFAFFSDTFYLLGTKLWKEKFWHIAKSQNLRLVKHQAQYLPDQILITGHTHRQEYLHKQYLNPGMFNYGIAQYCWLDNNKINLVSTRY